MRLGISSWSLPWAIGVAGHVLRRPLSRIGLIERAIELGVTAVQYADNLSLEDASDDECAAIERIAHDHGIAIEIGTRGIGSNLHDALRLARHYGATFVRVVIDRGRDLPTPSEALDRLSAYAGSFEAAGVRLALENHDRFRCGELATLVRGLGDWAGICLDTVNSLGAAEGPDRVIEVLAPLAINVHLKDFVIRRAEHGFGFEVVGAPVGRGMLDVARVIDAVSGPGGAESAIIELWTPPQRDLDHSVTIESRWLAESVDFLRRSGLFDA